MFRMSDLEDLESNIQNEFEVFDVFWMTSLKNEEAKYAPYWSFVPLMNFVYLFMGPMIASACGQEECDESISQTIEKFDQKNLQEFIEIAKIYDLGDLVLFDTDEQESFGCMLEKLSQNFGSLLDDMKLRLIPEELKSSANVDVIWSQLVALMISDYAFSNMLRLKDLVGYRGDEFEDDLNDFRIRVNEEITEISKNSLIIHLDKLRDEIF